MLHPCLFTTERELTTNQSTETTEVQFGELINFTGVTNGSIDEGHLQEQKWRKDSYITSILPGMVTVHKSWKPRAFCTACRQLTLLPAGECPFQTTQLV